jgi:flagellar hook-length control protein FliK
MDEAQADLQGRSGVTGTRADVFSGNGNASGRQDTATDERNAKQRAKSGREGAEAAEAGRQKGADSADAGWTGFWSKIGLEVGETKSTGTGELLKAAMVGVSTPTVSSRMVQTETVRGAESYVSSDILRQVENGMFKNLGQGGHRITLNLTPDELGSVTVMLTVKDKDVQAVIRAETPEAARIISEQAARVRENLEQQGFKVTKLDVQTGLPQQQDQSAWQGAGQHNEARRQQEELDMRRTALRILGMGSGAAANADASKDNPVQMARNEGVDVFA